jgi:hypothetical protein
MSMSDLGSKQQEGPVCDAEYPLISPGKRTLLCVEAKVYRHPRLPDHPWKCQLKFTDGFGELEIYGFLHLGSGPKMHAGRTSKYWKAWCIANGGPPRKRQVMSARIFKGQWFECGIETVKKGSSEGDYSIVREISARLGALTNTSTINQNHPTKEPRTDNQGW